MHTENWVYNGRVKRHLVQLVHFPDTERLLIKLNGATLFEENYASDTPEKVCSFFVDDELCEVKLSRTVEGVNYKFYSHYYSTGKASRDRVNREKRRGMGVLAGIGLLLLVVVIPLVYFSMRTIEDANDPAKGHLSTTAIITEVGQHKIKNYKDQSGYYEVRGNVHYKFQGNDGWHHGALTVPSNSAGEIVNELGFPIEPGNTFELAFVSGNYRINQLQLQEPTEKQILRFRIKAREACMQNLPEGQDPNRYMMYCDCYNYYIYLNDGLEGVAQIYHQHKSQEKNKQYNKASFLAYMQQDFIKGIENICAAELKP